MLKQAHVRAQAVISGRQLRQQLRRQLVEVQRPGGEMEPADGSPHSVTFGSCTGQQPSRLETSGFGKP